MNTTKLYFILAVVLASVVYSCSEEGIGPRPEIPPKIFTLGEEHIEVTEEGGTFDVSLDWCNSEGVTVKYVTDNPWLLSEYLKYLADGKIGGMDIVDYYKYNYNYVTLIKLNDADGENILPDDGSKILRFEDRTVRFYHNEEDGKNHIEVFMSPSVTWFNSIGLFFFDENNNPGLVSFDQFGPYE